MIMKRKITLFNLLTAIALFLIAACDNTAPTTTPPPPTIFFDASPTPPMTPVPLILTPVASPEALPGLPPLTNSQSSKSLAINNGLLVAVNSDSNSVTLVDTATHSVINEILVGTDPRTVAITPDGTHALITLRADNALAVIDLETQELIATHPIGHMPYGVVTDGRRAYVSNFADDQIAVLDLETGEVIRRLDVPNAPTGLTLSEGWLLISHFYHGEITLANVLRTPFVLGSVNAEPDGNLARAIVIAPDGQRAYIPHTRTGLALISLQYQQDWFPVVSVLDTASMTGNRDARITVSMVGDYAANMPFDVAFSADGDTLYTVLAGNDMVLAIDLIANDVTGRIPVGANPRGIVLDDQTAYVLNALDGTISVIDTANNTIVKTITITQIPLDAQLLRGKVLFNQADAPTMSDDAVSCAMCHFDGGMDGRTWINFRSGPRNTPVLGGSADLPPYNWAGDMDELHDTIEDQIRYVMLGDGLIDGDFDATMDTQDAGRSADLDALTAYVASLESWPSPYRNDDGSLTDSAQRGMDLFMSGSPGCSCHAPPLYTDLQQHNIPGVVFSLEVLEDFDTPTLRGLWASAPYMHDGVAQTLEELLTRTDPVHSVAGDLTEQQLQDLIAFLLSL
jgi:YVTN family beta-propeller protein